MFETNSPERSSSVPPGHKLIALLIAVGVAIGLHGWFNRNPARSASAELTFDPGVARRMDPGLSDASEPAVAIAQSLLTDPVVAELSKSAWLSSSGMTTRIGEFRSRLELTQPSARLLRVQFHDADPAKSTATANAVAKSLLSPSSVASSTPAAAPQPAPGSSVPPKKPVTADQLRPADSLPAALGDLAAQLSSTDRELDNLSSENARSGRRRHAWESSSYSQSRQQLLLKSRVNEAQRKIEDLRTHVDNRNKERLAEIQRELSAALPAGRGLNRHAGAYGFNGAGTSRSELRRERAQLARTVSLIERDRQAIVREQAAPPAPDSGSDSASASGLGSRSDPKAESGSEPSAVSESDLTSPSHPASPPQLSPQSSQSQPSSVADPSSTVPSHSPFQLARLAGTAPSSSPSPVPWLPAKLSPANWSPSAAAGLLCGLIYFGFAAWRSRSLDYDESDDQGDTSIPMRSSYRLITPDPPAVPPTPGPTPSREPNLDPNSLWSDFFDAPANKRASFSFEPPEDAPSPPSVHEDEGSSGRAEVSGTNTDPPEASPENVVGIADPWADEVRQKIAQTEIGRRLEDPSRRENSTGTSQWKDDSPQRASRPDRLAG